jgi:RNA polymerase sigma-70 factor (ECF subfamily)
MQRLSAAPPSVAEADCVARIRAGDVACFTMLLDLYAEPLRRYAYMRVGSRAVAEEIVQDVFCAIWTQRHALNIPGPIKMYLYKAIRNRAANVRRHVRTELAHQTRITGVGSAANSVDPARSDDVVAVNDLSAAAARVVTRMPPRSREVWRLSREHHMTYAEIAEFLHLSVKTVEVHMGRALTVLRAHLADWSV